MGSNVLQHLLSFTGHPLGSMLLTTRVKAVPLARSSRQPFRAFLFMDGARGTPMIMVRFTQLTEVAGGTKPTTAGRATREQEVSQSKPVGQTREQSTEDTQTASLASRPKDGHPFWSCSQAPHCYCYYCILCLTLPPGSSGLLLTWYLPFVSSQQPCEVG